MSEVGTASPTIWIALENIFYFTAFIAVNLAVMNLLPIPALDGGRIFHFVGLVLLLVLMGAVAINDVYKIVT